LCFLTPFDWPEMMVRSFSVSFLMGCSFLPAMGYVPVFEGSKDRTGAADQPMAHALRVEQASI
jgi:hypothetical protein